MIGNFCVPVNAMPKKHRNRGRKINPTSAWHLNKTLARCRSREFDKDAVQTCPSSVLPALPAPPSTHAELAVAAAKPEEGMAGLSQEDSPKQHKENIADLLQKSSEPKQLEPGAAEKSSEATDKAQEKVWGYHPSFTYMTFIGFDDIDSEFPERIRKDSVYYIVSEKLKIYYQLWKEIELKLIALKSTLSSSEYFLVHNSWWENSTPVHTNVFLSFPYYIREAYEKSKDYPDVVLGRDDCQVKIIEHMQKEWSLESKFFAMEILTCSDTSVWIRAETKIDAAIEMQRNYLNKLMVFYGAH